MSRAVDLFVTYRFLKLLVTPWQKQEAYKFTWPTKKEVLLGGFMVFVLATLAAIFFLLLDQIYKFLLDIVLAINF